MRAKITAPGIKMNVRNKIIITAIAGGIILYFLDALIYYLVFAQGHAFLEVLITAVPLSEIYNRLILISGMLILGFIITAYINDLLIENEILKQRSQENKNGVDTEFISSLSHQIRTPLNAIVGFSELLKDPNLSIQSKQTYINHIHSSGSYLLQLVNNLTDISSMESRKLKIERSETRIYHLFEELKEQLENRKLESGRDKVEIILDHGVEDRDFTIMADHNRLKQVISNLLENAVKYTDEGKIEFSYEIYENNSLAVHVSDTSQGFSQERLEMIMNRYRNLTDNYHQPFDAVSLRLTISINLIKSMGGEISAESRLGKGSSFLFTIPVSTVEKTIPAEEVDEMDDPGIPHKKEWGHKTILITEDVESNFIYLRELLRPTEAQLIWARNGKEAIKEVEKNRKINLVLMDILMPQMDGYEASKKIKEIRPDLPIIAQTAYSIEGEKGKESHMHFDEYLIKPVWSPQLISAIENFFRNTGKRK